MKKIIAVGIIIGIIILASLSIWYLNKSPQVISPIYAGCGIEFKLLNCDFNSDTLKANVEIQLIKGKIEGFNAVLHPVKEGVSPNNQFFNMEEMETRIIQFDFSNRVTPLSCPCKVNINPIPVPTKPEDRYGVCIISASEINC